MPLCYDKHMIDIIIPTCNAKLSHPDKIDPSIYPYFKKALHAPEMTDSDLQHELETRPIVDFCEKMVYLCTDATKTPYQIRISHSQNGFIEAVNQELTASSHDVVLLNDDAFVTPGWLEQLVSAETGDIRGCKVLLPILGEMSIIDHVGGVIDFRGTGLHLGSGSYDLGQFETPQEVVFVTFACAYIKRSVIDTIGLLDTNFGKGYYEDVDYCCTARKHGFSTWYHPISVYHIGGTSFHYDGKINPHSKMNREKFIRKWMLNPDNLQHIYVRLAVMDQFYSLKNFLRTDNLVI